MSREKIKKGLNIAVLGASIVSAGVGSVDMAVMGIAVFLFGTLGE